jgi:hypothetical protein
MYVADQLDAARRELGMAYLEASQAGFLAPVRVQPGESADWGGASLVIALPPGHSAATSRDKTG